MFKKSGTPDLMGFFLLLGKIWALIGTILSWLYGLANAGTKVDVSFFRRAPRTKTGIGC